MERRGYARHRPAFASDGGCKSTYMPACVRKSRSAASVAYTRIQASAAHNSYPWKSPVGGPELVLVRTTLGSRQESLKDRNWDVTRAPPGVLSLSLSKHTRSRSDRVALRQTRGGIEAGQSRRPQLTLRFLVSIWHVHRRLPDGRARGYIGPLGQAQFFAAFAARLYEHG